MSKENNNEYISRNIYALNSSKTQIILSIITEISKLEEKLNQIKEESNNIKNSSEYKLEIENIKQNRDKIYKEIKNFQMNLLLEISNKDNFIKKKQYSIKEISKKINNYKNILSTYENLAFNSPVLQKYLMTNNYNQFLTDEQIDDILSKTQNITKNDNLIQKTEKEYLEKKEELKQIENEQKKILCKINEVKENIKMMKEEKYMINNELVNYLSLKETFESIIKTNLQSLIPLSNLTINNEDIKEEINFDKDVFINNREKYSRNRVNNDISNIQEENDSNEITDLNNNSKNYEFGNINKKIWENKMNLYKYEIYNLDANKISNEICNDIFDLFNLKLNINNTGKSIAFEKNKYIKLLSKGNSQKINDRYNFLNSQNLSSDIPRIKRTKSNIIVGKNDIMDEYKEEIKNKIKSEIKNLINNINENKISPNNFTECLSNIIINIVNEKGYKLNKRNLLIYLSCVLKKSFYEYQISSKIKFLNKDYKNIKKLKKKIYDKLQDQLTKLNSKIESINNTIILQENKLKLLNNNAENKKNKIDKSEIDNINGNIDLSLDEQNYIQLCRKANSFLNEKNEIEKEIEMIENDKKLEKYQGELKIKNMKNELIELDKQIISKEKELLDNKRKLEEKIYQLTKSLDDKYNTIKENIILYKRECANIDKQNEYNDFIERINSNIKNDYYKSLFNLEKFYVKNQRPEIISNTENYNINDNILKSSKSFNYKTFRKNPNNMKLFSLGNELFSHINNRKINKYNLEQITNKNNLYQDRIKNNYINIFDSYNNLNNYFFQFQSPSTMISLDKQTNENNIMNQIKNKTNETNISPFSSSSKFSSSKKKKYYTNEINNIKPKNLIYNLRYLSSDNKIIKNKNKMNNINELKLTQNNDENKFLSGLSYHKKYSKSKNDLTLNTKSNTNMKFEGLNLMNNKQFCYFRILYKNKRNIIYNPLLENTSLSYICQSPFNFIKSTIYIDKLGKKIKIYPSNQIEPIEIKSENIDTCKINSFMSQIISVYKDYKYFKENNNNKDDINLYIKKIRKMKLYEDMNNGDIKKCCLNQKFSFELILKEEKIIEFLFTSYEEYRTVNNNIRELIKDKKESLYNLFNITKFEYPK